MTYSNKLTSSVSFSPCAQSGYGGGTEAPCLRSRFQPVGAKTQRESEERLRGAVHRLAAGGSVWRAREWLSVGDVLARSRFWCSRRSRDDAGDTTMLSPPWRATDDICGELYKTAASCER
jgi:hypothetical protein